MSELSIEDSFDYVNANESKLPLADIQIVMEEKSLLLMHSPRALN